MKVRETLFFVRQTIGAVLVAASIFVGCLSAAFGDPKGFARTPPSVSFEGLDWPLAAFAIGFFISGFLLILVPKAWWRGTSK